MKLGLQGRLPDCCPDDMVDSKSLPGCQLESTAPCEPTLTANCSSPDRSGRSEGEAVRVGVGVVLPRTDAGAECCESQALV